MIKSHGKLYFIGLLWSLFKTHSKFFFIHQNDIVVLEIIFYPAPASLRHLCP